MATSFMLVGLVVVAIVVALIVVVVVLAMNGAKGAAVGVSIAFGVVLLMMASVFAIFNVRRVEAREQAMMARDAAQESYQEALVTVETLEGASDAQGLRTLGAAEARAAASLASEALAAGNYSLAEEHAAKATALRPQVAEYWTGLGMAEAAQGKKEAAIQHYEKALLLLNKEERQRYLDQAMLLAYLGRIDDAQTALDKHKANVYMPKLSISMFLSDESRPFRTGVTTRD